MLGVLPILRLRTTSRKPNIMANIKPFRKICRCVPLGKYFISLEIVPSFSYRYFAITNLSVVTKHEIGLSSMKSFH